MPETKISTITLAELTTVLIKELDVHEGLWGPFFEFGFGAANVATAPDGKSFVPAAMNFVQKVGIQRFDSPNNLTVDAAQVNPSKTGRKKASSSKPK
jgi:hypothetical protein